MTAISTLIGALVGAAVALLHQHASWQASRALVRSQHSAVMLRGLPLRVGLPAASLFVLARWTAAALVAGLVAFGVVALLAAHRRLARGAE